MKEVVTWPLFRVAWILLPIIVLAGAAALVFLSLPAALIAVVLLAIIFLVVFVSLYYAARTDRDTSIERNELKSILVSLNDGLVVYSKDFRVMFFNPAAERLFKISSAAVTGTVLVPQNVEKEGWRTFTQVIFPALAPRVIPHSKDGEIPQVVDLSFTEPRLELRVATTPVNDEHGNLLAFMKIVRDRTAPIDALRSRSEFISIASHQLRGPVTDIRWALESLSSAEELTETNKQVVVNARAAADGLLRRIEDLIDIARMEDGQFGYNFVETDLAEFAGKVLADVLPAARKAGVKLYFDRPTAPLPRVMIDEKRLSIALMNLLENAIRYNVENGEVIVKVDKMPDKPYIAISVHDTGIGVPPESLGKLFNKFYRADNAVKTQTEGSGLGLYIAKSILQAHGGIVWAESELNRGTTISLAVPTDPNLVPKHEVSISDTF